jgi:hypothetical protein
MEPTTRKSETGWQLLAAYTCFLSAILALVLGFLFTTRSLLNAELHPVLHGVGIVLLIVAIPLVILGGHCLDLRDKRAATTWPRG